MKYINTIKVLSLSSLLFLSACVSIETEKHAVGEIITPHGSILIWLYKETPKHRNNFIHLANSGYWDVYTFNRVIEGFVIQGGCPDTAEGFAYSIHLLAPEFRKDIRHKYGTFAAGRDDNPGKLSAGCQFYIVQDTQGIARLDDNYTAYGTVFKGMDVVEAIVLLETNEEDKPLKDIPLDVNIIYMTQSEISKYGLVIPN